MIILGNMLGEISSIFLALSVHKKSKDKMLLFQTIDAAFTLFSCLVLGGLNRVIANLAAIIRNLLKAKKKDNRVSIIAIVSIIITNGIINFIIFESTWFSLFPIIASVEYTLVLLLSKSYISSKISLFINQLLWIIYSLCINNFVSSIIGVVLCINTAYTILNKKDKLKNK